MVYSAYFHDSQPLDSSDAVRTGGDGGLGEPTSTGAAKDVAVDGREAATSREDEVQPNLKRATPPLLKPWQL